MAPQIQPEEIENRFGYHKGTEETMPRHKHVRSMFVDAANFLIQNTPAGRAQSLALTALQEAAMWSNFAIAEQAPVVKE